MRALYLGAAAGALALLGRFLLTPTAPAALGLAVGALLLVVVVWLGSLERAAARLHELEMKRAEPMAREELRDFEKTFAGRVGELHEQVDAMKAEVQRLSLNAGLGR
jgi:hypothetical protein